MGKLYEEIFWLNRCRNGGSTSAGMVAQSKTEWWLNLSGLGAQRTPEYSTAIVFARYIFLAVAMREEKDDRSIGPLFYEISDEIADITFEDALRKLELFLEKQSQIFNGIHVDICALIAEFIADLPADLAAILDSTSRSWQKPDYFPLLISFLPAKFELIK